MSYGWFDLRAFLLGWKSNGPGPGTGVTSLRISLTRGMEATSLSRGKQGVTSSRALEGVTLTRGLQQ